MMTKPLFLITICFGLIVLIQSLVPTVMALKESSNIVKFMPLDQRTGKRINYVLQKDRGSDMLDNIDNIGPPYDTEPFDRDTNSEELSALMVDYANMIRNDVTLLDNSVETRTRKRGNIKFEKYSQAIPDPPCTCEYSTETKYLGEEFVPRYLETRNCSKVRQQTCKSSYVCKEILYNVTILRKRDFQNQESLDLPNELKKKWIAERIPISVGCVCTRDYIIRN